MAEPELGGASSPAYTFQDAGEGPGRRRADNGEEGANLGGGWKLTEEPPPPPPLHRRKGPLPAGPTPDDVPGPPKRKDREGGNEPPTPRKKVSRRGRLVWNMGFWEL